MNWEADLALDLLAVSVKHHKDTDLRREAMAQVRKIAPRYVREMAAEWLVEQVRARVRVETLEAERAAQEARVKMIDESLQTPEAKAKQRHLEAEWDAREEEIARRHAAKMAEILQDWKRDLHMEWVQELLDSSFALPDGTRVLWGEATVEQHAERVEMLMKMAGSTIETAARHQLAIDTIRRAHVECLNDLETVEALGT